MKGLKTLVFSSFFLFLLLFLRHFGILNPYYYLSNEFLIKGYQATHLGRGNREIMLVNTKDFPSSIIKDQIEILSYYDPAVIGVDFFPDPDSISQEKVKFEKVVLPIKIYEDSVSFAPNVFTDSAHYGFINIDSYFRFTCHAQRKTDTYYSFPAKIIQLYDSNLFKKNVNICRDDIINYAGNTYGFTYLGDLSMASPALLNGIKGKIVLMGYLGEGEYPEPDNLDEIDSHKTPHAMMYGVVFWANVIHTLLGHQINQQNLLSTILIFTLIVVSSLGICRTLVKMRFGYFILKSLQLTLIVVFFIIASFVLHKAQMLIDYEIATASIIIVPEFVFWFWKTRLQTTTREYLNDEGTEIYK